MRGRVDVVISEDSDLLAFGCPAVLFKMDRAGECTRIRLERLGECTNPSLNLFTHAMFRFAHSLLPLLLSSVRFFVAFRFSSSPCF
jgi:hypothetical protein